MDDLPGPGFRRILRKAAALSALYGWVRDCCAGKTVLCLLVHLRMTRKAQEALMTADSIDEIQLPRKRKIHFDEKDSPFSRTGKQ